MNPLDEQDRGLEQQLRRYRPAAPAPELMARILAVAGPALEKTVRQNSEISWQKAFRPLWTAAAAIALIFFATNWLGARLLPAPSPINMAHLFEVEANPYLHELAFEWGMVLPKIKSSRRPQSPFFNRTNENKLEFDLELESNGLKSSSFNEQKKFGAESVEMKWRRS